MNLTRCYISSREKTKLNITLDYHENKGKRPSKRTRQINITNFYFIKIAKTFPNEQTAKENSKYIFRILSQLFSHRFLFFSN